MSNLGNALQRVESYLSQTFPDALECLAPGLSLAEINRHAESLSLELSEDLLELYQWRNGTNPSSDKVNSYFLFPGHGVYDLHCRFLRLDLALTRYNEVVEFAEGFQSQVDAGHFGPWDDLVTWTKDWFLIADIEKRHIGVSISTGTVYEYDYESLEIIRSYANLASLFEMIAECCELGLYKVVIQKPLWGDEYPRLQLVDDEREEEIYQKYRAGAV